MTAGVLQSAAWSECSGVVAFPAGAEVLGSSRGRSGRCWGGVWTPRPGPAAHRVWRVPGSATPLRPRLPLSYLNSGLCAPLCYLPIFPYGLFFLIPFVLRKMFSPPSPSQLWTIWFAQYFWSSQVKTAKLVHNGSLTYSKIIYSCEQVRIDHFCKKIKHSNSFPPSVDMCAPVTGTCWARVLSGQTECHGSTIFRAEWKWRTTLPCFRVTTGTEEGSWALGPIWADANLGDRHLLAAPSRWAWGSSSLNTKVHPRNTEPHLHGGGHYAGYWGLNCQVHRTTHLLVEGLLTFLSEFFWD